MSDAEEWRPISLEELEFELRKSIPHMNPEQLGLWNAVQIPPEKWRQEPYGADGGGFWVVAILGKHVIWFNDIEDGFSVSRYTHYGAIDEYWCNQDDLDLAVQSLVLLIATGRRSVSLGPPMPIDNPPR
jgi:hypothetical protein